MSDIDADNEQEQQMLDAIEKWLERDVRPHVLRLEHADEYPIEMVEQMKELGLFGATIGVEYGGLGLKAGTYAKIVEKIAATWMSLSGIFNSHLIMAACVERNGTDEQKNHYLPKFATGEIRGGLALTEPDAGTDLQGIKMRAKKDGDHYIINGTKTWISNGIHGTCFALLVKTDASADPAHKGMSCFIAEKGPGFTVSKKLEKLGYKGIDSAELIFQDYKIHASKLIGGKEGRGMQTALGGLELGRINVAARGCGIAGARLLTYDAARIYDKGERCDMEAGMAKYFASEAALENATECLRIHGGYGYSKEYHVERYYRDAPLMCIGEGTNEMQRIIIARQMIARYPA
jgi:alkylation response protein AidB-like acyl-CoA dehydrogenase